MTVMPSRYLAESVVGTDGAARIPASVCDRFGIHPGDTLEWAVDDQTLVVRIVRYVPGEKAAQAQPSVQKVVVPMVERVAVSPEAVKIRPS